MVKNQMPYICQSTNDHDQAHFSSTGYIFLKRYYLLWIYIENPNRIALKKVKINRKILHKT